MKTNAQTYTLPLIREGVTNYIKAFSTKEAIKESLGLDVDKIGEASQPADAEAQALAQEAQLAKARLAILQRGGFSSSEGED